MMRPMVVLLLCLAPALAAAQPEPPPQSGTVLHLSEQAARQVVRDRLRAVLRVEAVDSDATRLQAEINRRMAAALNRAKSVADVTAATGGYSVQQEQPQNQKSRWRGTASLSLTAREPAPLLSLAGGLQQDGLIVTSLGYELSPEAARSVEDELTATAIARLRQRAERVAAELGLAVERMRELRLGNATGVAPIPRAFAAAETGGAVASSTPLPVAEPGETTVTVAVNADILLMPKR
jgi:uncharacterized protein